MAYVTHQHVTPHHPSRLYALAHPLEALAYVLALVGNPFSAALPGVPQVLTAELFGALHVGRCLVLWRARQWPRLGLEFWLIAASYANALLIMIGRVGFGVGQALSPRYGTLTLFAWLAWSAALLKSSPASRRPRLLVGALLVVQLVLSARELDNQAGPRRARDLAARRCLQEALQAPAPLAAAEAKEACLLPLYPDIPRLVSLATRLERRQPVIPR